MNRIVQHTLGIVILVFAFTLVSVMQAIEKVTYTFSHDPIDVVIPCHPKDATDLERTIASVRAYVQDVRRIMVISSEPCTEHAEWIDEAIFPFTKYDIAYEIFGDREQAERYIRKPGSRIGWLYQQFLKLYAPFCVPDISSNVLIVDADVVFLKSMQFVQRNGAGLYAVGGEYNPDYFTHAGRVLPFLGKRRYKAYSGVAHHMLFQRPVLEDFFACVYDYHGVEPWRAIARVMPRDRNGDVPVSAMSEYEMYFNFVFSRTYQVKIRHVRWTNGFHSDHAELDTYKKRGYSYVAIHNWGA